VRVLLGDQTSLGTLEMDLWREALMPLPDRRLWLLRAKGGQVFQSDDAREQPQLAVEMVLCQGPVDCWQGD
jgi:hypothetical protein